VWIANELRPSLRGAGGGCILEARSREMRATGNDWHKIHAGPGTTCWTVICCDPHSDYDLAEIAAAIASDTEARGR
jgi:hypothetical protein